jgi:O-antigen/teichoic acid export membrane protein
MAVGLFLFARSAWVAIAVWLISTTAVGAIGLAAVLLHARKLPAAENAPVGTREYLNFCVRVAGVNLVSLLNYRADLYIVAMLANTAALGMYTIAVSAAESLLVPTQVAALITSPHIGSLEVRPAAVLTARCVRNNMLVALVVCGVLFALAPAIVHLLYGNAFAPVVPALRVLLIGVFAMSLGSPMSSFFTLRLGQPEIPMRLAGISAAICLAMAFVLVPVSGMLGAATASTVAYIIGQSIAIWYFNRSARIGVVELLVPTGKDLAQYRELFFKMLADGRQLLRPSMR